MRVELDLSKVADIHVSGAIHVPLVTREKGDAVPFTKFEKIKRKLGLNVAQKYHYKFGFETKVVREEQLYCVESTQLLCVGDIFTLHDKAWKVYGVQKKIFTPDDIRLEEVTCRGMSWAEWQETPIYIYTVDEVDDEV